MHNYYFNRQYVNYFFQDQQLIIGSNDAFVYTFDINSVFRLPGKTSCQESQVRNGIPWRLPSMDLGL
jgi:hypothetical protein